MAASTMRTWATPLTIGSFLLISTTGIMMFFEWERGLMTVVHQWFSWFFVMGAGAHILVNVRPFKAHLKSRWGKASVVAFAAVLAASLSSWGTVTGPQIKRPIEQALVDAPISALAGITRTPPDVVMQRFADRGIAAQEGQSLGELAAASGVDENRLLAIVFALD